MNANESMYKKNLPNQNVAPKHSKKRGKRKKESKKSSKKTYIPNSKEKYMCAKHKKYFTEQLDFKKSGDISGVKVEIAKVVF